MCTPTHTLSQPITSVRRNLLPNRASNLIGFQQLEGAQSSVFYLCLVDGDQQKTDLKIDVHYYLANQIHPVVSRLVAPIEGTSPAHIADCLGLDSASYRRSMAATASAGDDDGLQEVSDALINLY